MTEVWAVLLVCTGTSLVDCRKDANTPLNTGTAPATVSNSVAERQAEARHEQQQAAVAQQAAQSARYSAFISSRDAILKQIQDNETAKARLGLEKTQAEIKFNETMYSGKRLDDSDWEPRKRNDQELADNLTERLALDDQLKAH